MHAQRSPWERQPHETYANFAAFRAYRDLKPHERSVTKALAKTYGAGKGTGKLSLWEKWCTRYKWVARATAWDEEQDRVARIALVEEIAEMNRRHIQIALSLTSKAAQRLAALEPIELSPSELRQYLADAVKLERLARGEADSILDQRGTQTVIVRYEEEQAEADDSQRAALD